MNARALTTTVSAAALILTAASTQAAITSTAGQALQIGPPASALPGALTGINAFAWDEQINAPFAGLADMVNNPANNGTAIPGLIGGVFDSHMVHFEGIPGIIGVQGTVTFNAPIVAVMFNQPNLDASDVLGSFGTIYPTGNPLRGISAASIFSINANVLTFQLISTVNVADFEQIRVLTQVPAPGVCGLFATAGLFVARRRR